MLGTITLVNKRLGCIVIRDEVGEFSLALLMGEYVVAPGGVVRGAIQRLGCTKLKCLRADDIVSMCILYVHCSESEVIRHMRKVKRAYLN